MADAELVLTNLLHKIAAERGIKDYTLEVVPISSGGANYTSQLYTVTIKNEKELHLFAKIAAMGEKVRAQTPMKLYDTERIAYKKLFPEYQRIEEERNVPKELRLRIPEHFGSDETWLKETIVLEDLVKAGFVAYDRFKSIDWPYAKAAVTQMARLHALSMALQRDNPEKAAELLEVLHFEWDMEDETMKGFWDGTFKRTLDVTKEENKERLKSFIEGGGFEIEKFKNLYDGIRCTTIVHIDYRPSNLMHKIFEDGSYEVIPVDFQTLRPASPVIDLLYFIFTGSDEEFRAQHYDDLVQHYYSELCVALRYLKLDPNEVYSKEDFEFEYKDKLKIGLMMAMFTLPIVTVEAEDAPKVNKDMDMISLTGQKSGKLYPDRMNGVINDFIRWGVL